MTQGFIVIDQERCKGCGLCPTVCPKHIIELDSSQLNAKGYHPAMLTDAAACTGCALCAVICPDVCINVWREPKAVAATG